MTSDRRILARTLVVAAGVATLIGSGGGFMPDFELDLNGLGTWPTAHIEQNRLVVQAGTAARFVVRATGTAPLSFRWCRMPVGSASCETLAGVTGDTLTIASPTLADDGALYQVTVTDAKGGGVSDSGVLFVSSSAPVRFGDGDFPAQAWTVTTTAEPATGGPSAAVDTASSGGNPGAWRRMVVTVPIVPSTLRIEQWRAGAVYDPGVQGAIHLLEATEDCVTPTDGTSNAYIGTVPLLLQGGRRYVALDTWSRGCSGDSSWVAARPRVALAASDFRLVDGPACTTGESCPDFGAGGAPLQLGFAQQIEMSAAGLTGTRTRGIDNWSLTVWRR